MPEKVHVVNRKRCFDGVIVIELAPSPQAQGALPRVASPAPFLSPSRAPVQKMIKKNGGIATFLPDSRTPARQS